MLNKTGFQIRDEHGLFNFSTDWKIIQSNKCISKTFK